MVDTYARAEIDSDERLIGKHRSNRRKVNLASRTGSTELYDWVMQVSGSYELLEEIVECRSHWTCLFDELQKWQMALSA